MPPILLTKRRPLERTGPFVCHGVHGWWVFALGCCVVLPLGECEIRATAVGRLSSLMPCDDDTLTGDNSDPIGLAPDPHLVCLSHNSPRVPIRWPFPSPSEASSSFLCVGLRHTGNKRMVNPHFST